jgi:hypothetical protein
MIARLGAVVGTALSATTPVPERLHRDIVLCVLPIDGHAHDPTTMPDNPVIRSSATPRITTFIQPVNLAASTFGRLRNGKSGASTMLSLMLTIKVSNCEYHALILHTL